jgi:hypothetical protein
MMELQQTCFRYASSFPILDTERRLEYLEAMNLLLEKQTVVENMRTAVVMLGGNPELTVESMFADLENKVNIMIDKLQSGTGG